MILVLSVGYIGHDGVEINISTKDRMEFSSRPALSIDKCKKNICLMFVDYGAVIQLSYSDVTTDLQEGDKVTWYQLEKNAFKIEFINITINKHGQILFGIYDEEENGKRSFYGPLEAIPKN